MSTRRSHGRRALARRQRGQALIWLVGVMGAAVAVLYGVYNVTQLTAGKQKAVNAADTAALAGSMVEARLLNLMAYNNRTMVANEVFLVQMASIDSWTGYFARTAENIGMVVEFIPYLQEVGAAIEKAGEAAEKGRTAVGKALDVMIGLVGVQEIGFNVAHKLIVAGGSVVGRDAAGHVVAANNSSFGDHADAGLALDGRKLVEALTFARNVEAWNGFFEYADKNKRGDTARVVLDSRDRFTADRPGSDLLDFDLLATGGEKHGGSELRDFDHWENEDTYELWAWTGKKHYAPVGWARTNMNTDSRSSQVWSPDRTAQEFAESDGQSNMHGKWRGIPAVYDVKERDPKKLEKLEIGFTVVVSRAKENTLTTTKLGMESQDSAGVYGTPRMDERLQDDRLAAIGHSHVVFERPQNGRGDWTAAALVRADSAKEYGSLFSPYWEARLAPIDILDKVALYEAMNIPFALAWLTP